MGTFNESNNVTILLPVHSVVPRSNFKLPGVGNPVDGHILELKR